MKRHPWMNTACDANNNAACGEERRPDLFRKRIPQITPT